MIFSVVFQVFKISYSMQYLQYIINNIARWPVSEV